MKKYLLFTVVLSLRIISGSAQQTAPAAYGGSVNKSYIRTWDATSPQTRPDTLRAKSLKDVKMTTQYVDGLGRPIQTIVKGGSLITGSSPVDMVSANVYDEFGREATKYLPFAANSTGGNSSISDGLFKLNPFQQDSTFNKSQFADESWYYAQTNFEASPLNRILESFAPGNNWVGTSGGAGEGIRNSVKNKYWINTALDSVVIWNVSDVANSFGTYTSGGYFGAGKLYKNITVDEGNHQIVEFKDKGGKVLLKRVQLTAIADTGLGKGPTGWLSTYYIYDDLGQLRGVVQPRGVELLLANSWSFTSDILNEQSFRYEYDKRGRMIMKKVPGAGAAVMIYDVRDRLIMTQDSVMRAAHKWFYTKYDTLNRPTVTGLITDGSYYNDAAYHRSHADTSSLWPVLASYTNEELTKTFYDDYSWRSGEGNPLSGSYITTYDNYFQTASNITWPYPQTPSGASTKTKGMVTGTKTKVLNTANTYLYSVSFYDDKGRVIQTQSTNVATGTDVVTTQYGWNGQPLVSIIKNEKAGTNSQTSIAVTQMTYDDHGRVTKVEKKISNTKVNSGAMPGSFKTILQNEYDALGQLKKKKLGATPLDSLSYDYNIRGWMLGANRAYVKDTTNTANYFGFDLGYDKTSFTVNGSSKNYAAAQYNGNIGGMIWKSTGDDEIRKYDFTYDAVNRLIGADFNQLTNNSFSKSAGVDFSVAGLNYDANGNIGSMNQKGWKPRGSVTIDSLLYTYINNTNKLLNVVDRNNDTTTKLGDFRSSKSYMTTLSNNKTTAAADYSYDVNGNLLLDNNKDITAIRYNQLNLPDSIVIAGKGTIKYVYDAGGNKLKKITTEGTTTSTTLYLFGNFVNDTLQFLPQEEGRVRFKPSDNSLQYDYFIKDHLGNVRVVLTEEQRTDMYNPATLESLALTSERLYYSKVDSGRVNKSSVSGYPSDTYTSPNDYIQKLNGDGVKIGAGIVLKVMAGDKFNLHVSSWWTGGTSHNSPANPLDDLLSALTGSVSTVSGSKFSITELNSSGSLSPGLGSFLNTHSTYTSSRPKAFVNWVLFDERFNFVSNNSGFEQVGASGSFTNHNRTNSVLDKSGYLYIYVSNETPNIDVFFDNLQVTHIHGPLTEETHYYPFGLTMAGISSQAAGMIQNKRKFNAGSELQNQEFSDGNGLEMYATQFRMYDPQLGRWHVLDPRPDYSQSLYSAMANNPISYNDPLGDTTFLYNRKGNYRGYIADNKANEIVIAKGARILGLKVGMALGNKSANDAAAYARGAKFADGRITSNTIKELTAQWKSGGVERTGFLYADKKTKEVHISVCQSCGATEGAANLQDLAKTYSGVAQKGEVLGMWHTHPPANSFAGTKPSTDDSNNPSSNIPALQGGALGVIVNQSTVSLFPIHSYASNTGEIGNHDAITTPKFGPNYSSWTSDWQYGTFNTSVNSKNYWDR